MMMILEALMTGKQALALGFVISALIAFVAFALAAKELKSINDDLDDEEHLGI